MYAKYIDVDDLRLLGNAELVEVAYGILEIPGGLRHTVDDSVLIQLLADKLVNVEVDRDINNYGLNKEEREELEKLRNEMTRLKSVIDRSGIGFVSKHHNNVISCYKKLKDYQAYGDYSETAKDFLNSVVKDFGELYYLCIKDCDELAGLGE